MKITKQLIQWTIDKWGLKADMGERALIGALEEVWNEAQKVKNFNPPAKLKQADISISLPQDIRDEMDVDMEDSGMAQGEIESCLNHWNNKYIIQRRG